MSLLQARSWRRPSAAVPELADSVATDSYRLACAFMLVMALVTVDVFNVLDRGWPPVAADAGGAGGGSAERYLILLIPIVAIIWMRMKAPSLLVRAPSGSDLRARPPLPARHGRDATSGSRSSARPTPSAPSSSRWCSGLLYLLTLHPPRDREVTRIIDWLGLIGLVYVIANFLVNYGILPGLLQYKQYRNASVAYVALAAVAAFVRGRRRRLLLVLVLTAAIFVSYPSATSVLVALTVLLTLFLTGRRATGLRSIVVVGVVVLMGVVAVANFQKGVQITSDYFSAVGKVDANAGRLDLWTAGIERWQESPFIGSVFSGEAVAVRSRDQRPCRTTTTSCCSSPRAGCSGAGILVAFIVMAEITLVRRYRRFVRWGDQDRADLLRIILCTSNAFLMTMLFNPVLPGRIALGHHLRAVRDRDVAGRSGGGRREVEPRHRARLGAQRTRGAIFLNAARLRRCAHAQ